MMKKAVWVLLCSFITLSGFAQTASRDVVLLLDTSASMSDYYLEVRDYLSGPFLREFLQLGDTFHLISFSDRTRLEISRRIDGQSDIEIIVGRLLLMYPLDPYSDIISALRFAERYITSLPGSRAKSLVFISDGDNNPAPGTRLESVNIQNLIAEIATRLNRSGVNFEFIPIPPGSRPRLSSSATPSQASATQAPSIPPVSETRTPSASPSTTSSVSDTQAPTNPPVSGTQASTTSRPSTPVSGTQTPTASGAQALSTTSSVSDTQAPTASRPSTTSVSGTQTPSTASRPSTNPPVSETQAPSTTSSVSGTQTPSTASRPSTNPPVSETQAPSTTSSVLPPKTEPTQELEPPAIETGAFPAVTPREEVPAPAPEKPSQPIKWPRITLPILPIPTDALFFVVIGTGSFTLIAIAALALLTATRLHNAPNRMMGVVAEQALLSAENASDTIPPMLSLFVKDQAATRGRQNLHILQPGYSLSLGGDESDDFVISIVTVPRRIAHVRFDGKHYTFIPRKPHSLPDIGSPSVQDCVGKEIRVVHKNFEVYLSIEQRENPLCGLGSFLHSVNSF